jgi:hypothetical protein
MLVMSTIHESDQVGEGQALTLVLVLVLVLVADPGLCCGAY